MPMFFMSRVRAYDEYTTSFDAKRDLKRARTECNRWRKEIVAIENWLECENNFEEARSMIAASIASETGDPVHPAVAAESEADEGEIEDDEGADDKSENEADEGEVDEADEGADDKSESDADEGEADEGADDKSEDEEVIVEYAATPTTHEEYAAALAELETFRKKLIIARADETTPTTDEEYTAALAELETFKKKLTIARAVELLAAGRTGGLF